MRSLTSDFEKDKLKLRNIPLFKVGSVLDLSFYQEFENSFFSHDDLDFLKKHLILWIFAKIWYLGS